MNLEIIDLLQDEIATQVQNVFTLNQLILMSNASIDTVAPYGHLIFSDLRIYYSSEDAIIGLKNCDIGFNFLWCYDIGQIYGGVTGFDTPYKAINAKAKQLVTAIYNSSTILNNSIRHEILGIGYEVKAEPNPSYNISSFTFLITTQVVNSG